MTDSPAARTWVLLNFPYAEAQRSTKTYRRKRPRNSWRIVVGNPNKPWESKTVISGPSKHPTEYKAWKAAGEYMNKVNSGS